jgi:hypothetical protein
MFTAFISEKIERSSATLMGVSPSSSKIVSFSILVSFAGGLSQKKPRGIFSGTGPWAVKCLRFVCGGYYRHRPNRTLWPP